MDEPDDGAENDGLTTFNENDDNAADPNDNSTADKITAEPPSGDDVRCNVCDKTFKSPHNLRRHWRTHTGERPYKCPTCGSAFSQDTHLKKHCVNVHKFTPEEAKDAVDKCNAEAAAPGVTQ